MPRTAAPSTRWRRSTGRSGRASSSMFARCAVSGVRSSCEASAISCCCACCDSSRAASMALKSAARLASSSRPLTVIRRLRSRVALTSRTAPASARTGRSTAFAASRPSKPAASAPPSVRPSSSQRTRAIVAFASVSVRAVRTTPSLEDGSRIVYSRSATPPSWMVPEVRGRQPGRHRSVAADERREPRRPSLRRSAEARGDLEEAGRVLAEEEGSLLRRRRRALRADPPRGRRLGRPDQRDVDLVVQLRAHVGVDHQRRDRERDEHGAAAGERQARTQAHGSRSR